jgi:hypothetical protein
MPKVLDPPLTTRQAGQHTAAALPGARVRRAARPFPEPQIGQVQPEDLAAAQPASTIAATIAQSRCVRGTRTSGTPWPGRCRSRRSG